MVLDFQNFNQRSQSYIRLQFHSLASHHLISKAAS